MRAIGKNKESLLERAILVGIRFPRQSRWEANDSLEELRNLAYSAGATVAATLNQEIKRLDPAFLVGRGKIEELKEKADQLNCNLILFDEDLTPTQNRNLEEKLQRKVIDRTGLILDIFAQRARTKEGKLQVELAQCLYLLPRLVGQWGHFSRQTGGIGTRGPGETQLEVDRRRIREKITHIRKQLEGVKSAREIHRAKRLSIPIPTVSLIGYTNAGKSTLFRVLTKAEALVEDKLFATLDPTVRRLKLPSGREILMTDTVGFIRKLPHSLVESFKATFEEIEGSDLLLHVIDVSHPSRDLQIQMVKKVLSDLGLSDKPLIEVYNKTDLIGWNLETRPKGKIYISAAKQMHLEVLLEKLEEALSKGYKKLVLEIPHQEGSLIAFLHRYARILSKDYTERGVKLEIEVYKKYFSQLKGYRVKEKTPSNPSFTSP